MLHDSRRLSFWYVWVSLGLFPVAGQSLFLIHPPVFEPAVLRVPGGEFVIEATGHREMLIGSDGIDRTPPTQYVRSAALLPVVPERLADGVAADAGKNRSIAP